MESEIHLEDHGHSQNGASLWESSTIQNDFLPEGNEELAVASDRNPDTILLLTEFTLFPDLPTEIRLKIWRLARPASRVVRVFHQVNFGTYSISAMPPILGVCREVRDELMRTYQPVLNRDERARDSLKWSPGCIDFDNDMCYIPDRDWLPHFTGPNRFHVLFTKANLKVLFRDWTESAKLGLKHLTIGLRVWKRSPDKYRVTLLELRNIETITLVIESNVSRKVNKKVTVLDPFAPPFSRPDVVLQMYRPARIYSKGMERASTQAGLTTHAFFRALKDFELELLLRGGDLHEPHSYLVKTHLDMMKLSSFYPDWKAPKVYLKVLVFGGKRKQSPNLEPNDLSMALE